LWCQSDRIVDRDRRAGAEADDLALLQDAEQLDLQLRVAVAISQSDGLQFSGKFLFTLPSLAI
jgi:hypothetical protein